MDLMVGWIHLPVRVDGGPMSTSHTPEPKVLQQTHVWEGVIQIKVCSHVFFVNGAYSIVSAVRPELLYYLVKQDLK